jgi:hypothetical protein
MTATSQRIAIAEACGRHLSETDPDCLNDLNAMHEAEKVLTQKQSDEYRINLTLLCHYQSHAVWRGDVHATAAQRAESFLRTIGKWVKP